MSRCEACRLVVRDAIGQLRRSGHASARSSASLSARKAKEKQAAQRNKRKARVSEALESLCGAAEARHPRRIAAVVGEECEELLEDWESRLSAVLLERLETLDHGRAAEGVSEAASALREVEELEHTVCARTAKRCSTSVSMDLKGKRDEL